MDEKTSAAPAESASIEIDSAAASPAEGAATAHASAARIRRRLRWPLLIAGPVIAALIATYIYVNSGRYAETDNAYVKSDTIAVSAEVAGTIVRVAVEQNQSVRAGDVLFAIDDRSYRAARDRAASQLDTVRAYIEGLRAAYQQAMGELDIARTDVAYAERDVARERPLADQRLRSGSDLDEAEHTLETARQQVPILEQRLAQLKAQLGGDPHPTVEAHSAYRMVKAMLDEAELALERTVVRAPVDGTVGHVALAGTYATPGQAVLSIVSSGTPWIEANFKETELTHVTPGQPVVIRVDTYDEREWHGHVASISPATGAEFSVIPAQNATGNWVKIAQRIPVRIELDDATGPERLRAGMSAVVEIDTGHDREVPALLTLLRNSRDDQDSGLPRSDPPLSSGLTRQR